MKIKNVVRVCPLHRYGEWFVGMEREGDKSSRRLSAGWQQATWNFKLQQTRTSWIKSEKQHSRALWEMLCHLPRLPIRFFFRPDLFFSRPGCVGNSMICFWSDKLISNFNVFNNIKIALHYSVYMRTSDEKVRISDEAERVQSVSYSHIRSLSELYTVVCLREKHVRTQVLKW